MVAVSATKLPGHIIVSPSGVITADGCGSMPITSVIWQPVISVYVTVAVPSEIPVTVAELLVNVPVLMIVATDVGDMLHVPLSLASVSNSPDPVHTDPAPVIESGNG